jgi:hypothetical protein
MKDLQRIRECLSWFQTGISENSSQAGNPGFLQSRNVDVMLSEMSQESAALMATLRDHLVTLVAPMSIQPLLAMIAAGEISAKLVEVGDDYKGDEEDIIFPEDFSEFKKAQVLQYIRSMDNKMEPFVVIFDIRQGWMWRIYKEEMYVHFHGDEMVRYPSEPGVFDDLCEAIKEGQVSMRNRRARALEFNESFKVRHELQQLRDEADLIIPINFEVKE